MRLSWSEIRINAAKFASEWKDASYEKGETHSFYNDLFAVFGVQRRRVATYEQPVRLLGAARGFIDLFWSGVLLVEQKSAGRNLRIAKEQALSYFPGLRDDQLPRYLLVSDFQNFELYDLENETDVKFPLQDFHRHVEKFAFVLGLAPRAFKDQPAVNILASELMGKLHDALFLSGYRGSDLEVLLVRLLFCLFADDTGIFEPRDIFTGLVQDRTHKDGHDLGAQLTALFDVLDQPVATRQSTLDAELAQFPHVNGKLFARTLRMPAFNASMRELLLEACEFSWDAVSPAIFGSLFQSVMNPAQRRAEGAHYTTEENIRKVIETLFLDELWSEFNKIKNSRGTTRTRALKDFHGRLPKMKFLDPACGCGNFLIVTYRELRLLEIEVLSELETTGQLSLDVGDLSLIDVDQFYGIELNEFPARIAEVALWMTDHLMNVKMSERFGKYFARIPLRKSASIVQGDAMEVDWSSVLPAGECMYLLGNPPFIGSKQQTVEQRKQIRLLAGTGPTSGTLDYVSGWFLKGAEYMLLGNARLALVSTSSVVQGEQVAQLWPKLLKHYGLEIEFAHQVFPWSSDARGRAKVSAVIIGLAKSDMARQQRALYSYAVGSSTPTKTVAVAISPYLISLSLAVNRYIVVPELDEPLWPVPAMRTGTQPIDGGHYIVDEAERLRLIAQDSRIDPLLRPYIGTEELVKGKTRYIIYLKNVAPSLIRSIAALASRMREVSDFRASSSRPATRALANFPDRFQIEAVPTSDFLVIPEVSSENRQYLPMAFLSSPTIPSNLVRFLDSAELWQFAILTSGMHMAWLRIIGGRLDNRYRYSIGIVYNPFPWPNISSIQKIKLAKLAQKILSERAMNTTSNLEDLYDITTMPAGLRSAHLALDAAVEKAYAASRPFRNDTERAEHLLQLFHLRWSQQQAVRAAVPVKRARARSTS
jgi:type I restriction-modification system DNA methylase subunit